MCLRPLKVKIADMAFGALEHGVDANSLREALTSSAPRLRAYVHAKLPERLRDHMCVEDVLQEVWIAAFRNRASFRADRPDALDRWLTTIAQNRVLNTIKTELRIKRGGRERFAAHAARSKSYVDLFARIAFPGRTPSGEAAVVEAADAVRVALAGLPDARREVLVLRFIEGRSCDEIATFTNRTKAAVKGLLFHGLRQLHDLMGPASRYLSDAASADNHMRVGPPVSRTTP